jgi:hypothetical protein
LLLAAVMAGLATSGQTQDGNGPVPENEDDRRYVSGWDCNPGYRIAEGACVALEMPANSYPTGRSHGTGWACEHGYREVPGGACVAVRIPENGFLDASGLG